MKVSKLLILGVLAVALCMAGSAFAVVANGSVTPNSVPNNGTSVLHFTWDIYDWSGTAGRYTFEVRNSGGPSPLYIQYSDGYAVDNFPGISVPLQNVNGTAGGAAVHLRNPEYPGTHNWTVPATLPAGDYEAWARLYLQGASSPTAGAFISFTITQAVPDIDIEKYVSVDGGVTWLDADSATGPSAGVGSDVKFKVEVCNTGQVALTGIVVTDSDFTFTGVATSLDPGQCDESDVVTVPAVAGQQYDLASVVGTPPIGGNVTDEDPAYYIGLPPHIDIEKYVSVDGGVTWLDADTAPGPSAAVGTDVKFKVEVCNDGGTPLTGIVVTDSDFTFTGVVTSLDPGQCDESDVVTVPAVAGQQYDLASVVGTPPVGGNVTDEDPANYFGQEVGDTFCTFTQGFWGNKGGRACGERTTDLIMDLIDQANSGVNGTLPVIVGDPPTNGIRLYTAECIIDLLPAGGTPGPISPAGNYFCNVTTDNISPKLLKNGRFNNVLIGQVVALTLNLRVSEGCVEDSGILADWVLPEEFCTVPYGDEEACAEYSSIPEKLVGLTVAELLEDANRMLAGLAPINGVGASIGDIYDAVTALNEGFDECRTIVPCIRPEICGNGCDDDGDGLVDLDDPDCQD